MSDLDVREDVVAAMESLKGGSDGSTESSAGDASTEGGPGPTLGTDSTEEARADDGRGASRDDGETVKARLDRARDASGRFAAKQAAEAASKAKDATEAPVAGKPATTQTPAPGAPTATTPPTPGTQDATKVDLRAPQAWKEEVREKYWATLPTEVKEEWDRREKQIRLTMDAAAPARQFTQDLHRRLAPYEPTLRAFGPNPAEAMENLAGTMHQLQNGPPQARAAAFANLLTHAEKSGVTLDLINAHLSGQPAEQPQVFDRETILREAEERFERRQVEREKERELHKAASEARQYSAEFLEPLETWDGNPKSVRGLMAGLVRGGAAGSVQEAYEQACQLHPETAKILRQREAAEQAKAVNASTQRARAAASTIKSSPATASDADEELDSVQDYVRAAMKKHATR